jgi:hypothetical protein
MTLVGRSSQKLQLISLFRGENPKGRSTSMTARLFIFSALLVLLSSTQRVWAQDDFANDLVCSKNSNVAAARFGGAGANPVPSAIDGGLSSVRSVAQMDCTLPNGWPLRIRIGERQVRPYGMGGADPPAFFSLWVAGRRIVSRAQ